MLEIEVGGSRTCPRHRDRPNRRNRPSRRAGGGAGGGRAATESRGVLYIQVMRSTQPMSYLTSGASEDSAGFSGKKRRRPMARYAPALSPLVLKALHFEGKRRGLPMTRLADACITKALEHTQGWKQAQQEMAEQMHPERRSPALAREHTHVRQTQKPPEKIDPNSGEPGSPPTVAAGFSVHGQPHPHQPEQNPPTNPEPPIQSNPHPTPQPPNPTNRTT